MINLYERMLPDPVRIKPTEAGSVLFPFDFLQNPDIACATTVFKQAVAITYDRFSYDMTQNY